MNERRALTPLWTGATVDGGPQRPAGLRGRDPAVRHCRDLAGRSLVRHLRSLVCAVAGICVVTALAGCRSPPVRPGSPVTQRPPNPGAFTDARAATAEAVRLPHVAGPTAASPIMRRSRWHASLAFEVPDTFDAGLYYRLSDRWTVGLIAQRTVQKRDWIGELRHGDEPT